MLWSYRKIHTGLISHSWIIFIYFNTKHLIIDIYFLYVWRNYVVQRVIQMKTPLAKELMIQELQSKFDRLSVNKYASNVVEYLLKFSNQDAVKVIVEEIMRSRNFLNVLQDPFGNYVVQRALRCAKVWLAFYLCVGGV